jgi:hypothetical protein
MDGVEAHGAHGSAAIGISAAWDYESSFGKAYPIFDRNFV